MKTFQKTLLNYSLGIAASLLIIGLIHLYSLIAESTFSHAEWDNILVTALISGLPFGIAIWAFTTLKNRK